MKVWTVWQGIYSDRQMLGIFSTKEKAEEYRQVQAFINPYGVDDVPIPYTLDEPETYQASFCIEMTEKGEVMKVTDWWWDDDKEVVACDDYYEVRVNFQPSKERMIQAARDKLFAYLAQKEGI